MILYLLHLTQIHSVSQWELKRGITYTTQIHFENYFIEVRLNNISNYTLTYTYTVYIDLDGGIAQIEMLGRTNILALVGGGMIPKFSPNKAIIWNEYQSKVMAELRFTSNVKKVKLTKTK